MERQNAGSPDWAERLLRVTRNLGERTDRQVFVDEITRGALEIGIGHRAYTVLMDGDTLAAEAAHGEAPRADAPQDPRKRGARLAIAAVRALQDPRREVAALAPEIVGRSIAFPFVVKDQLAGAVIVDSDQSIVAGSRDVAFAVVYVTLAARLFAKGGASSGDTKTIRPSHKDGLALEGVGAVKFLKPVAELERDAIELALRQTNWSKEEAAKRLGISRASIYMKVKKFGLQKPPAAQY